MSADENKVAIDLDTMDGQWIGTSAGHVDRYDFMVAVAEYQGGEIEVGPKGPHPRYAYLVEFECDQHAHDDPEHTCVQWQTSPQNPLAHTILPITILYGWADGYEPALDEVAAPPAYLGEGCDG